MNRILKHKQYSTYLIRSIQNDEIQYNRSFIPQTEYAISQIYSLNDLHRYDEKFTIDIHTENFMKVAFAKPKYKCLNSICFFNGWINNCERCGE